MRLVAHHLIPWLVLGTTLTLPPVGTEARGRTFCRRWLELATPEKHAVVVAAEPADLADGADPARACRAGLAAGVRRKLDAECRNWPELMDFEVRMVVDGVYAVCTTAGPERS